MYSTIFFLNKKEEPDMESFKEKSENKLVYLLALLPGDLPEDNPKLHNTFFKLKGIYPNFLGKYNPDVVEGNLFCEDLTSALFCLKMSSISIPTTFLEQTHELPNMRKEMITSFEETLSKEEKEEFKKVSRTLKELISKREKE